MTRYRDYVLGAMVAAVIVSSCKRDSEESADVSLEPGSYKTEDVRERSYQNLPANNCLVEMLENFTWHTNQLNKRIGAGAGPQCIPFRRIGWRGRIDVQSETQRRTDKPVSVALVVDNSVSLTESDSAMQRRAGLIAFLRELRSVRGLRLKIFFFQFCNVKELMPINPTGADVDVGPQIDALIGELMNAYPQPRGSTNFIHSVNAARYFLGNDSRSNSDKHMVVFSDGMPYAIGAESMSSTCQIRQDLTQVSDADQFVSCASPTARKDICRDPVRDRDFGYRFKNKFPSADPFNYAVGMGQHIEFINKMHSTVQVHTVRLYQKCYEAIRESGGNSTVAGEFEHLCTVLAPSFFNSISNGKQLSVSTASELVGAFTAVSQVIHKQLSLSSITYNLGGQNLAGRPLAQAGDTGVYDFAFDYRDVASPSGSMAIKAVFDNHSYPLKVDFQFKDPDALNPSCGYQMIADGPTSTIPDLLRMEAGQGLDRYRVTCRIRADKQCEAKGKSFLAGSKSVRYSKAGKSPAECGEQAVVCINGSWQVVGGGRLAPFDDCLPPVPVPVPGGGEVCKDTAGKPYPVGAIVPSRRYDKGKADLGSCEEIAVNLRCEANGKWVLDRIVNLSQYSEFCVPKVCGPRPGWAGGKDQYKALEQVQLGAWSKGTPAQGETCESLAQPEIWECRAGNWFKVRSGGAFSSCKPRPAECVVATFAPVKQKRYAKPKAGAMTCDQADVQFICVNGIIQASDPNLNQAYPHTSCPVRVPSGCVGQDGRNHEHGGVETRLRFGGEKMSQQVRCVQEEQRRICRDGSWGIWNGTLTELRCPTGVGTPDEIVRPDILPVIPPRPSTSGGPSPVTEPGPGREPEPGVNPGPGTLPGGGGWPGEPFSPSNGGGLPPSGYPVPGGLEPFVDDYINPMDRPGTSAPGGQGGQGGFMPGGFGNPMNPGVNGESEVMGELLP